MLGLVTGLLVGLVAAVTLAATTTVEPHRPDAPASAAADAYLGAWRRSQLGTWRVTLRWERQVGGNRLVDQIRIAQRPPDRLAAAAGAVEARRQDRALACAAGADGRLRCRDAGPAVPYDQEVDRQEAILRQAVAGPRALYAVLDTGGGCYELRLRFPRFPAPPYGRRARFCYDRATGAPTVLDIDRAEGSDGQVAVEVSARVTDADLAPPPGLPG